MPSLNRPNAPDRLPSSDFGNLFGRPRAVRCSDLTSANSTPSPLTTPNNYIFAQRRALRSSESGNANPAPNSPLASPSLAVVRQRPKQAERRNYHSDASAVSPPQEPINIPLPSSEVPLIVEEEQPVPLKIRTTSDSSSISSRARRLLSLPGIRITPGVGNEQPPSKARSGFKWKREFSGRWLEIRIGRKGASAEHSAQASGEATPVPLSHRSTMHLPLSQTSTVIDPEGRDRTSNSTSDQRLLPEIRDPLQSTTLTHREGLYCRTRRALGLKHDTTNPHDPEPRPRTSTDTLLDRVSSTLRFLPNRKTAPSPSSATTSVSNLSIATPPRWQRILNNSHSNSNHGKIRPISTSSSIREMMMGRPPIHTPEPEAMYTASDSKKYLAVDLTERNGTAFLPSEARRIHTPPLPTDAASPGTGKARGFFFDYNAPPGTTTEHNRAAGGQQQQQQQHGRNADWYRVKMNAIIGAADHDHDTTTMTREELAASVPEHLPNSPLCPRHPKHRSSGGMGECPFHGRNVGHDSSMELRKNLINGGGGIGGDDEDGGGGLGPRTSPSGEVWW